MERRFLSMTVYGDISNSQPLMHASESAAAALRLAETHTA